MNIWTKSLLATAVVALSANAQFGNVESRQAEIRGGDGDGKCTLEVVVDGVAEVEIRGTEARLRTLAGAPARWTRFQCNQAMPINPSDFQFKGIDGRGRQSLVRDPNSNRGVTVVRLEDPKGGSEGYTFDLMWKGSNGSPSNSGGWNNGNGSGWGGNRGNGNGSGWGNNRGNGNGSGWGNNGNNNGNGWGANNNNWNGDIRYRDRGNGSFRNNRGVNDSLEDLDVNISNGNVTVSFSTSSGNRPTLNGRVTRVDGDRVYADVNGNGISGNMMFRVENRNRVREVSMDGSGSFNFQLRWRN